MNTTFLHNVRAITSIATYDDSGTTTTKIVWQNTEGHETELVIFRDSYTKAGADEELTVALKTNRLGNRIIQSYTDYLDRKWVKEDTPSIFCCEANGCAAGGEWECYSDDCTTYDSPVDGIHDDDEEPHWLCRSCLDRYLASNPS